MTDLHTDYLGIRLASPIVASSGPLTRDVDSIKKLESFGAAAVVLPSLFEEDVERSDATGHAYASLIERAKAAVDIPVIASMNGASIGSWLRYAAVVESAGADAIELNLYHVAADPIVSSGTVESEQFGLVAIIADEVGIPVSVKISPYYSSLAWFACALQEAGAAGVVLFNRFYQPDLDIETREVMPRLALSTPEELRLPLRWTGILREHLTMSIAGSTGVHSGDDVVKLVLAGADVAMTTSSLLRNGPEHLATIEAQLRDWMTDHDVDSISALRGQASASRAPRASDPAAFDPAAFERANYIGNLASHPAHSGAW
jgi:dihydroorotate dehydrogenase (fumarate)